MQAIEIEYDARRQCTTIRISDMVFMEVGRDGMAAFYVALAQLLREYVGESAYQHMVQQVPAAAKVLPEVVSA